MSLFLGFSQVQCRIQQEALKYHLEVPYDFFEFQKITIILIILENAFLLGINPAFEKILILRW